jgi:hypothetical protein
LKGKELKKNYFHKRKLLKHAMARLIFKLIVNASKYDVGLNFFLIFFSKGFPSKPLFKHKNGEVW